MCNCRLEAVFEFIIIRDVENEQKKRNFGNNKEIDKIRELLNTLEKSLN